MGVTIPARRQEVPNRWSSRPGTPYDPEFRARAVELVRTRGLPRAQVARDLGINVETLRLWVKQAEIDAGRRDGPTSDEKAELARLRREVAVLQGGARDPQEGGPVFRRGERDAMSCYRFIAAHAAQHPVALSCRVLGVSRSGYYAWRGRARVGPGAGRRGADRAHRGHPPGQPGDVWQPARPRRTARGGERCGRRRVARLMRAAGLRGCHGQRRRVRTTTPDRQATPAPDRVERAFAPAEVGAPDRLWVADISYVATLEGWLFLAVVLDAFSRQVVGWAMADHLRTELVTDALAMAIRRRRPAAGLIHHSDQGCQYTSLAFGQRLQDGGILPSMGSVGDCFDNAVAEAFFATLKVELLHRQAWPTRAAARLAIFEFIEVWYNRQRRHSTLGYATPAEYEALAKEPAIA